MKVHAPTACLSFALLCANPAFAGARQVAQVVLATNPAERKFQQGWGYASAVFGGDLVNGITEIKIVVRKPRPKLAARRRGRLRPPNPTAPTAAARRG